MIGASQSQEMFDSEEFRDIKEMKRTIEIHNIISGGNFEDFEINTEMDDLELDASFTQFED